MAYSEKVLEHYEKPRNIGSLDTRSDRVGTALVGAPECGDVMKLQIEVDDNDSILDVGCGVAHLHTYLKNQGWNGKYLGFDPNTKAIDMIDEDINVMHGTIEDMPDFMNYDWAISSGVFNLGLKEEHSFWIIENMILRANKGIIFNMLQAPYPDPKYEAYYPERIKQELSLIDHSKIEIIEGYMGDDAEFTVYFYV